LINQLNEKIITPIVVGLLTIGGSFLIAIFTPGSFLLYPVFEIETDEFQPSENLPEGLHLITIKNIGWIQAKNVEIDISAILADSKIIKSLCSEGDIIPSEDWRKSHEIKIKRLSVNLECKIGLIQNSNYTFYDVVVTAEDAPAYKWFGKTQTVKSLSDPRDLMLMALSIIGVMSGIITLLIQWNNRKRREEIEKRISAFDPLSSRHCPKCGSAELERSVSQDPKRDDVYYQVTCKKCKWSDGGEL